MNNERTKQRIEELRDIFNSTSDCDEQLTSDQFTKGVIMSQLMIFVTSVDDDCWKEVITGFAEEQRNEFAKRKERRERYEKLTKIINETRKTVESEIDQLFAGTGKSEIIADKNDQFAKWQKEYEEVFGKKVKSSIWSEDQNKVEFDWNCLPAWCNSYVAMDEDKTWYSFQFEPRIFAHEIFSIESGECTIIHSSYAPKNFRGNWKDSLMKNPNHK